MELYDLTAHEIHDLLVKREVSAVEVTESVFQRIDKVEPIAAHALKLVPVEPRPDRHVVASARTNRLGQRVTAVQHLGYLVPERRVGVAMLNARMVERVHRRTGIISASGKIAPVQKRQTRTGQHRTEPVEIFAVDRATMVPRRVAGIVSIKHTKRVVHL